MGGVVSQHIMTSRGVFLQACQHHRHEVSCCLLEGKAAHEFTDKYHLAQEDGEPIITPSYGAGTTCSGAKDVCVGDIVRVPVSIVSRLPQALSVTRTQLILSIVQVRLHQMAVESSAYPLRTLHHRKAIHLRRPDIISWNTDR